ncbi:MAG: YicC family protein [Sphingobacteriales bacterium]|nr:MAG: YicC family protein [Sphingobacteriales bacterium]
MLRSMTGFGQTTFETPDAIIRVEIKSVNSKNLDLTIRAPKIFAEKEITLRSALSPVLQRGKVSVYIENEPHQSVGVKKAINSELLLSYYNELKAIAESAGANTDNIFSALLSQQEIIQAGNTAGEKPLVEWETVENVLNETIKKYDEFRLAEGNALANELKSYIQNIESSLKEIEKRKDERLAKIRTELRDKITSLTDATLDENRLEQELIYYAEKLDVTEEIVRLSTHLKYFTETMNEEAPGKKLGFISQEIGREINTIGSKSNDAGMQKFTVLMKEELEKIKEQVLNVL